MPEMSAHHVPNFCGFLASFILFRNVQINPSSQAMFVSTCLCVLLCARDRLPWELLNLNTCSTSFLGEFLSISLRNILSHQVSKSVEKLSSLFRLSLDQPFLPPPRLLQLTPELGNGRIQLLLFLKVRFIPIQLKRNDVRILKIGALFVLFKISLY